MDLEIVKILIQQGGGYLLAFVIFYFYQKSTQGLIRDTKRIIEENTKAFSQFSICISQLTEAIKRMEDKKQYG